MNISSLPCALCLSRNIESFFSFLFEMTDGNDEKNSLDQNPNILISKIDHRWQGMYIRDFWSIRWFRFVVPNVTYVSLAQSHPARVAFFCRWHTSFMFDKFLYSSSTMNYNMASIWSMSPRNYRSQHTQHSSLSSGQCRTQWLRFNFRSTLLRWHSRFSQNHRDEHNDDSFSLYLSSLSVLFRLKENNVDSIDYFSMSNVLCQFI